MTHAKTVLQLSQATGFSRKTLHKHLADPAFPLKEKKGWPVANVLRFLVQKASGTDTGGTEKPRTLKDHKLVKEIQILNAKLEQIKGTWIPYDDVASFMVSYAQMVNSTIDLWVETAATLRNPTLLKKARELRDKVRQNLMEGAAKLEDVRSKTQKREAESEGMPGI